MMPQSFLYTKHANHPIYLWHSRSCQYGRFIIIFALEYFCTRRCRLSGHIIVGNCGQIFFTNFYDIGFFLDHFYLKVVFPWQLENIAATVNTWQTIRQTEMSFLAEGMVSLTRLHMHLDTVKENSLSYSSKDFSISISHLFDKQIRIKYLYK